MQFFQDTKLTDLIERELVRDELASQPKHFVAVQTAFRTVVEVISEVRAYARLHNVNYANS